MSRASIVLCLLLAASWTVNGFVIPSSSSSQSTGLFSTTEETANETTDKGLLKRDRYVATNRFAVRKNKAAKFEKRWATRKSKLAVLDGFQYFHLMRRVTMQEDGSLVYDEGGDEETSQGNYVSFTIWNKKSDFSAWRTGEAFKEAHGGTSIGAFVSTMVNSALVLRGAPRPAFYDGLLLQKIIPDSVPETTAEGWREVPSSVNLGVDTLPAECFVAQNQFFVPRENAAAFEQRWANRESKLKQCDGFVAFSMLRRDGQAKGHGTVPMDSDEPTYLSTTIWKDVESFNNWRSGAAFQQVHGQENKGDDKKMEDHTSGKPKDAGPPLWIRPPKPVFYEGTLVISSEDGA